MARVRLWPAMAALCALSSLAFGAEMPPATGVASSAWQACEQPDLKTLIDQAPALQPEDLGTAVYGVDAPMDAGRNFVLNPDGKSYDILLWYRKAYRQNTCVYIVDLGTGQVKKQKFEAEEGKIRVEQGFGWWGVVGDDGKLYGSGPDWGTLAHGGGGFISIYRYDPATNEVSLYKRIKDHVGESAPLVVAPDGWIYGSCTYRGADPNGHGRASAYGFNPATGDEVNFGPVGEFAGGGYGNSIAACDQYVYVACGQTPWSLVVIDRKTGEQKILLRAPDGGYNYRMYITARYRGGGVCYVQQSNDAPKQYYWLYHGQAIPKKTPGWELDDSKPWPDLDTPRKPALPRPELHLDQTYPAPDGNATLYWRPVEGAGEWRAVPLGKIDVYPLGIHRVVALPDGRLFGTADGYKGRFVLDPGTDKITTLGDGGTSTYTYTVVGNLLYWSGYPSGQMFVFDPAKPWNLHKPLPPGQQAMSETDPASNPRRVHEDMFSPNLKTRVKKMLSSVLAADGCIYFGGKGQRDYDGGGLAWYDPKSGKVDGFWEPLVHDQVCWVTTALNRRYLVLGTRDTIGHVFLYDTVEHQLGTPFVPVPGADMSGPLLEVAPGRMLGEAHDPQQRRAGILYGVDALSGEVLFRKSLPYAIPFDWAQGIDKWDYRLGPDGFIWTFLGKCLVRIDPKDARVHVVGKLDVVGHTAFIGNDLYLAGTQQLRRLKNIVPSLGP